MRTLCCVLSVGCFLLGVTLAAETNKLQPQQHILAHPRLLRNKRGLLAALFGTGEPQSTEKPPTEVLPVYGDPAQPPLHMLYGHSTGPLQQGPYPPYPVMFLPGAPVAGEQGPYLPMLAYGGVGDNNHHLPTVIGWPEPTPFAPLAPEAMEVQTVGSTGQSTTSKPLGASSKNPSTPPPPEADQSAAKSAYLRKLNLTPAEESELKRLAKLLGVTDFEHLPPFEDVKALLGTSTSGETIKAIKEYASTPDGLELIKDYVMSYQPAKRISLGKEPYGDNEIVPGAAESGTPEDAAPSSLGSGFFAHLRRLKSLLTFGYFDAAPAESAPEVVTPEAPIETPFTPNEFPGFEIRDVRGSGPSVPIAHYLIPVRTLPRHSSPAEFKYASALPFPYAVHYPSVGAHLQDLPSPFTVRKEPDSFQLVSDVSHRVVSDTSALNELAPVDATLPKRIAPPTLATGEVHSFERADIEQPVRTTTPAGQQHELTVSTVTSTVVDHNLAPILADVAELADDTTDFVLNVLDTEQTT